jgi:hypothetical protein
MVFSRDGNRVEVRTRTEIAVSFLGIVIYRLDSSSPPLSHWPRVGRALDRVIPRRSAADLYPPLR